MNSMKELYLSCSNFGADQCCRLINYLAKLWIGWINDGMFIPSARYSIIKSFEMVTFYVWPCSETRLINVYRSTGIILQKEMIDWLNCVLPSRGFSTFETVFTLNRCKYSLNWHIYYLYWSVSRKERLVINHVYQQQWPFT
jgi:hypothetical protein